LFSVPIIERGAQIVVIKNSKKLFIIYLVILLLIVQGSFDVPKTFAATQQTKTYKVTGTSTSQPGFILCLAPSGRKWTTYSPLINQNITLDNVNGVPEFTRQQTSAKPQPAPFYSGKIEGDTETFTASKVKNIKMVSAVPNPDDAKTIAMKAKVNSFSTEPPYTTIIAGDIGGNMPRHQYGVIPEYCGDLTAVNYAFPIEINWTAEVDVTYTLEVRPNVHNAQYGDKKQYNAFLTYTINGKKYEEDVTNSSDWSVTDPAVGDVIGKGLISAEQDGETIVKATYKGKGLNLTANSYLIVSGNKMFKFRVEPKLSTIKVGEQVQIDAIYNVAMVGDLNENHRSKWKVDNTSIASVVNDGTKKGGLVTGVKPGKVTVTATLNSDGKTYSDTATVIVEADEAEPPPEEENIPPVANLFVGNEYYWVEEVEMQDNSYDPDGEIASSQVSVDGMPSGLTKKFPRVTQPEGHTASLTVTDDKGASDTDTKQFTILPTTPVADVHIGGTLKENRAITLDATPSNAKSPVHVAPIDYSLSTWDIHPLSGDNAPEDIKIRTSSDYSKRELLVRTAGTYEVTVTVTNIYGETSAPVTKQFTVVEDEVPQARFTVDKKKALRDGVTKKAQITLTDNSIITDGDTIKKRIWYMEHDSNNDGRFGTQADRPREILSNTNEKTITFESDRVGNFRFSLNVIEDYGQPTLLEFIEDKHYMRDSSDVLDPLGTLDFYQQPENFNIPETDKAVEIDNSAPNIDFGIMRHNKVDVVLNYGGMDTATQQHKTGSAPNGGRFDHYYFSYNETDKNKLMAYSADLENDLKTKGIDAKVTINNGFYRVYDADGECIRDIPVYGWTYWTTYENSSVTTTSSWYSPPSGWSITGSSSRDVYKDIPWCYSVGADGREWSHSPPCDEDSNETTKSVYSHTEYTYSIQKATQNQRWEVQYYTSQGCGSTEQINLTDFTDSLNSQTFRADADKYYVRLDKNTWDWTGNTTKWNTAVNKLRNDSIFFWSMSVSGNRLNGERLINTSSFKGQYQPYDAIFLSKNVSDVKEKLINQYMIKENGENLTIVLGYKLDYTVNYDDFEKDPELKREWMFTHDQTKVNGRVIDNQPSKPIPQSGLWVNSPLQLEEVGTYKIKLRAMDDPIHWKDERFFDYRKWSDEEIQREYIVNVHRRPIADFTFNVDVADNYRLDLDPTVSYDTDYQFNRPDKGIIEYTWDSYTLDGVKYNGAPPKNLTVDKVYDVTLMVQDIDGAYASVTKRISTQNMNIKPVAKFDVQSTVSVSEPLKFTDQSYDPNGDPLTNYQFTVRKQGNATILKTLNDWPTSFKDLNLGVGDYVIGLTVDDIPRIPPTLRSDLFEKLIKVIPDNNKPVSRFTLSPSPIVLGQLVTYTDSSYDPDGHPLINYSWKIEALDSDDSVLETFQTGVPPTDFNEFGGTGRYRVTQIVHDDPPAPLKSLQSEPYSIIINVVKGPDHPFAEFTWLPEEIIAGNTIQLDPGKSYDLDGTIVGWSWKITSPTGTVTTSTMEKPQIVNAAVGTYRVELHVTDNDGLRSKIPAIHNIVVAPKPPNKPPVANFIWSPFKPFLGENIALDSTASYDLDGTVVGWDWQIRDSKGVLIARNTQLTNFVGADATYSVTLRVRDNEGTWSAPNTQTINVNIAKLEALVTHTPEWKTIWQENGYAPDVNIFRAGEKFIIELTSTPANRVWGKVNFGGQVGEVDIPSSKFTLVRSEPFKMVWQAELWQDNFKFIPEGEYLFEFKSAHPINNPYVEASDNYLIKIEDNIFSEFNYHRNY
jgi:PKD repeat protein